MAKAGLLGFVALALLLAVVGGSDPRPNVLLMMADDLGYGDLGCYGNLTLRTPNIDRLAKEGAKLTQSLAAASICTPSRAAFLTGRYQIRSGMAPSHYVRATFLTASGVGLPATELTFGKIAKQAGYKTALLGKWHLGWSGRRSDPYHAHPLNMGFDYFYGIPLTNMKDFDPREEKAWRRGASSVTIWILGVTCIMAVVSTLLFIHMGALGSVASAVAVLVMVTIISTCGLVFWVMNSLDVLNSFFYRNYDLVEQPIHLPSVTRKLVWEGEQFLEERHEDGVSQHGPYGDTVEELDWGVGRLLTALDRLGMADNTLVYFTSDNGGHVEEIDFMGRRAGGYNGVLRGGKSHGAPDGGIRVPTLIRWPGKVKAGHVTDEPVSLMDVLPTVAQALHVQLPASHVTDGRDLVPLLSGEEVVSAHEFLFHYCTNVWKLVMYEPAYIEAGRDYCDFLCHCNDATALEPPRLYDMTSDPGEKHPLSLSDVEDYSGLVARMLEALEIHRESIQPVPDMFAYHRMLWRFWEQPVCNFPNFQCDDAKFHRRFE
ncbi:hypothetical protein BaRGS_00003325 [Batillaria attramentaria]|uniref:Sulfatase N-terminal domain-containing protein n=1 Tax=Batillaria attramentaria TaxID=370345 RepID=A0ABD0M0Y7_9CAEN